MIYRELLIQFGSLLLLSFQASTLLAKFKKTPIENQIEIYGVLISLFFSYHHFLPLWLLPSFFGDEFVDDAHLAAAPELAFIMDAAIKL